MKTLFIALALLVSVNSQATSLHPDTFAQATTLKVINQSSNLETVESADLKLNAVTKQLEITLKFRQICPPPRPGQFACLAVSRGPLKIQLPIVSESKGRCGTTIYTAQRDDRPRDGNFNRVRVLDHRTMTCEIALPFNAMTQVELTMVTAGFGAPAQTYRLTLQGRALQSPFLRR